MYKVTPHHLNEARYTITVLHSPAEQIGNNSGLDTEYTDPDYTVIPDLTAEQVMFTLVALSKTCNTTQAYVDGEELFAAPDPISVPFEHAASFASEVGTVAYGLPDSGLEIYPIIQIVDSAYL